MEKNRVVRQNPGERNFHVFYALLAGSSEGEKGIQYMYKHYIFYYNIERLNLLDPTTYHYLNQSGCTSDPTINDVRDFANIKVLINPSVLGIHIIYTYI